MGSNTVEVMNLTNITQHYGHTALYPRKWNPVDIDLAIKIAGSPDYRCDSQALLGHYHFVKDGVIHLGWSGPFWYVDGYGHISQEIAACLAGMSGVSATIKPRDYDPRQRRCGGYSLEEWGEKAFVPRIIVDRMSETQAECLYGINFTYPADCHRGGFPRTIGYTMFETDSCPLAWVESMNLCRRLMVPSEHCIDAFRSRGVTVSIDVVPQGVNPDKWPILDRTERDQPFTFLQIGGLTFRKNPVGAARAFVAAFPNRENVRLVLKTRAGKIGGGFKSWFESVPRDDRIQIIAEDSPPDRMVQYYHAADCLLWPSRGEGFGLPPCEAMATGLPLIVAENSGMSQYCDPHFNYPVPCRTVKVPSQRNGGYPEDWGDCGNWWEPDFDALVETIRKVYSDRCKAFHKGLLAAEWVRDKWTIAHTCQKMLEIVCDDAKESGIEWQM